MSCWRCHIKQNALWNIWKCKRFPGLFECVSHFMLEFFSFWQCGYRFKPIYEYAMRARKSLQDKILRFPWHDTWLAHLIKRNFSDICTHIAYMTPCIDNQLRPFRRCNWRTLSGHSKEIDFFSMGWLREWCLTPLKLNLDLWVASVGLTGLVCHPGPAQPPSGPPRKWSKSDRPIFCYYVDCIIPKYHSMIPQRQRTLNTSPAMEETMIKKYHNKDSKILG